MPKQNIETLPYISIFEMKRNDSLREGAQFKLCWADVEVTVVVTMSKPCIELIYDDTAGFHRYSVALKAVPCYYGSVRWYFECPLSVNGVVCGRRVAILYKSGSYFGCRTCHQLTYPLQRIGHTGRWARFYRALQIMNLQKKLMGQRTSFWKGQLTKRQKRRMEKMVRYSNTL